MINAESNRNWFTTGPVRVRFPERMFVISNHPANYLTNPVALMFGDPRYLSSGDL